MTAGSDLELALLFHLKAARLPTPEQQWRFDPTRRFKFDLAYPGDKIGIEVDGATWTGGRHVRGKGYETDCEKLNLAALDGWRILRFTAAMVDDGRALTTIEQALTKPGPTRERRTGQAINPPRGEADGTRHPTRTLRQQDTASGR